MRHDSLARSLSAATADVGRAYSSETSAPTNTLEWYNSCEENEKQKLIQHPFTAPEQISSSLFICPGLLSVFVCELPLERNEILCRSLRRTCLDAINDGECILPGKGAKHRLNRNVPMNFPSFALKSVRARTTATATST